MFNLKNVLLGFTAFLVVSVGSGTVSAEDFTDPTDPSRYYMYTDNGDGTAKIDIYMGPGGDFIIPDEIAGLTVVEIGDRFSLPDFPITSFTLPDSVTTVHPRSFETSDDSLREQGEVPLLESIHFGSGVSTIGDTQFLPNTIPNTITVSPENQYFADQNGTGLYAKDGKTLIKGTASGEIAEGTEIIGERAFWKALLESVVIPESVQFVSYEAFANNNLTSVTVLNKDTELYIPFEGNPAEMVIKGFEGSTAEAFALGFGYMFEILSDNISGANASIEAMLEVIAGDLSFANELVSLFADRVTLTGHSQMITALFNDTLDVIDTRGNHAGYDVQVTMTDLVSGTDVISKDNITFKGLDTISADGVTGPADTVSASSPFSLISLGEEKGIGQHTMDFSAAEMDIFLSEKTKAGLYTGNMGLSLVSSP